MEHAWQDFGQKVDLTARLREILINYPEGTSILKELVQNADDAKATTVKFCLDHNQYATESVLGPEMAQFQGPALLAYNNGVFNDKDFESISRIGDSKKREQIGKTGRFGVGFNAIYHLTDVPSFVSGDHLVIFDPHCKHLPAISAANPGKKINFVTHDLNTDLADQAAPYHLFGCNMRQHFAGTLFRFPLRTQEQAEKSTISKQVYTVDSISSLFTTLKDELTLVLLFLKCIESIEVLQLLPGHKEPELLFSCSVANSSPCLLLQRSLFLHASVAPADETVAGTYQLDLLSRNICSGSESSTSFLVSQRRGPPQLLKMAKELSKQFQVPMVAWGAVAAEMTPDDLGLTKPTTVSGRAFCFLPLPASTSLPVHINGYFELSSNRRDVWHGSDMAGAARLRAQWNEALLQLVVAPAYLNLLGTAAKMLGPGDAYNRLWPAHDAPDPWQGVVQQVYGHLPKHPLLWSAAGGGSWLASEQCIFPDEACLLQGCNSSETGAANDSSNLFYSSSAVIKLPDDSNSSGEGAADGTVALSTSRKQTYMGPMGQALLLLGLPLVDMPPDVLKMMLKYLPEMPKLCTPAAARAAAAAHPEKTHHLQRQAQLVPLLSYCLEDVDMAAGESACQQLLGLRLLPLQDGALATIQRHPADSARQQHHHQQLVFVVAEQLELLLVGSQKSLLLDSDLLGPAITGKLSLIASYSTFNLQHLTVHHLLQSFLPQLLPQNWLGLSEVSWDTGDVEPPVAGCGGAATRAVPTWEWLQGLWQWLAARRPDIRLLLSSDWPLLPVLGSKLVPLLPLTASAVVGPGDDNWPEGLACILQQLGVHVLDTASFELPSETLLQLCAHKPTGPGVAAALCCALGWQRDDQQQQQRSNVASAAGTTAEHKLRLSLTEARLLRGFLLQSNWFNAQASEDSRLTLLLVAAKRLPLYELANGGSAAQQQQQQSRQAEGEALTVSIKPTCRLAPAGVYLPALDNRFLISSSDQQTEVMVKHLGVSQPTAAKVYRDILLPQLEKLPAEVRDPALLRMLEALPQLQQQDRSFMQLLMKTPFVPNAVGKLHKPEELYDPRVPELVALLDPDTCFPGPAFCNELVPETAAAADSIMEDGSMGGGIGFSSLSALQQLGLISTADLGTCIVAARFVERSAREGDEDMAVARGKALLSYLDTEAERLVGRHTAITSAAAAAVAAAAPASSSEEGPQQKQKRPGRGLFSAMQKLWGRGHQQQQQQHDEVAHRLSSHPADSADDDIDTQQQAALAKLTAKVYASKWAELARICWCPILAVSPDSALPWRAAAVANGNNSNAPCVQRLAAPCAARPGSDLWLVSAVMNVVDGDCRSPVLLAGLGWNAELPGAVLASQLSALSATNRHVNDAALAQKLARVVPVLYGALAALPAAELAAAAAVLEGQPTVWVGNGFVPAERVAFKGGLDLSPHLYVLPLELSPFRELLAALGAQEAFSAKQYTTLLQDLAREASGTPLRPQQLSQALAVAQALADVIGASGGGATAGSQAVQGAAVAASNKEQDVVLVPDVEGVLRPAAELAYDDAPWLDAPSAGLDAELRLVHPRLSAPVAEALGVASRRRLMLAASADCLALGLAGAGGAVEAFGQSEALTTRLRHIIQDYPEGPGVLLELVQNADDAGAHKAAFLLDARQHGTSSLLGPGMAAWQGPALLAYNDATFSPGDIAAIARIGQDGKMAQPAAIGRFGLGFNAVYHLTDLPSFVSGQHLVLFDPHTKYLPGASPAQPGLRVNLNRGQLMRQFPDAFAPYMHFGCTMEGSYPGTLFRFPLRSSTTAATSDIKSTPTTAAQALQLLQSLAEVLPQALLFLKSLRQIEVYVVGDMDVDAALELSGAAPSDAATLAAVTAEQLVAPRLLFRASLSSLDGSGPLQQPITHFVSSGGGGSGAQQLDAFYRRLAAAQESNLPSSVGRVQLTLSVSSSLGSGGVRTVGEESAQTEQLQLVSTSSGCANGVGVDATQGLHDVVREEWLVCNQLGGGTARALALRAWKEGKVKMIPWVGVAARLSADSAGSSSSRSKGDSQTTSLSCSTATAGRAFCFLPLPASTSLPVHINGYFELSSNRRDVWHGSDMAGAGRLRAQWNEALLESAVAAAYLNLLLEAAQLLGPVQQYWRLFPRGDGTVPEPWIKVAAAVYQKLVGQPACWSPVGQGSWLTPQQVLLPDTACYQQALSATSAAAVQVPATTAAIDDGVHDDYVAEISGERPAVAIGYVGAGAGASRLAGLLVSCSVPLVMAFSEEQQKCLLHWTQGIQKITPAIARKLLASNRQHLAAIVTSRRHQHRHQQPTAAALLEYCISDVQVAASTSSSDHGQVLRPHTAELLIALQQLHGLPLLPVLDGSVKLLEAVRGQSSRYIAVGPADAQAEAVYVCLTQQDHQLLQGLPHQVLHPAVGDVLQQQLFEIAGTCATNVAQLTATTLDQQIMAQLLPSAWRGQQQVDWTSRAPVTTATEGGEHLVDQQQQQPSRDFIKLLWQWLGERSDVGELAHWPVLPIAGGKLRLLQQPAQVLKGGDWTESLTSALLKLGCCLLDSQLLDFPCPALADFVHQPTAAGLLDTLTAAQAAAAAAGVISNRQQQGGGAGSRRPLGLLSVQLKGAWKQQMQELTAAERNQLRAYLLQAKWFTTDAPLTKQQQCMLYRLPIYEVHAPLRFELPTAATTSQQQQQQSAAAASCYHASLLQAGPSLLLPPAGVSSQVLGSRFLRCMSDTEDEILVNQLGVERLSMSDFLYVHLVTEPESLDQRALNSTLMYVLQHIRELTEAEDPRLPSVMRDLPLIPVLAAASGQQQRQQQATPQYAAPKALFDPRVSVFSELLDPLVHFPAPPFDGSSNSSIGNADASSSVAAISATVTGAALLDGLVLCGLRTKLDFEVFVIAATSISQFPSDDPIPHHRARALLHHLDQWAQQNPQPDDNEAAAWKALQGIAWCPAVVSPPDASLPWPHACPESPGQTIAEAAQQSGDASTADTEADMGPAAPRIAVLRVAPKLVAPAEMAWLVSAPLRLLGGAAAPSPALQRLMGWTQQQVLRPSVAIAQLMELGKMYPAGQVHDADLCAKLSAAAGTLYSSLKDSIADPEQQQLLDMTLSVTPSVWVGSGFAYPAVAALQASAATATAAAAAAAAADAEVSTDAAEPQQQQEEATSGAATPPHLRLLWTVPTSLQQQYPDALDTLHAIGVQQHHDFAAYAVALAVIAEQAAGQPLQGHELSTTLQLGEAAGQALLAGSGSIRQLQQPGVIAAVAALQAAVAAAAGNAAAGVADVLQLPDSQGVMAAPNDLYFNDAAWLAAEGLRLAHPELSQAAAEALGVRSVRYQHEVSEQLTNNIPCPGVAYAAAVAAFVLKSCPNTHPAAPAAAPAAAAAAADHIGDAVNSNSTDAVADVLSLTGPATATSGPVLTVLLSILAWADKLRTGDGLQFVGSMNVGLDEQQHGTQSLLHPGLAKLQGPSICIALRGVSVSAAQSSQYLTAKRPVVSNAGAAGDEAVHPAAAAVQLGLSSVWAITDVLQAMSGDTTTYWDPSGVALAQSAAEIRSPSARGRSVKHNQPGLTERFADQWTVWQTCKTGAAAAFIAGDVSGSADQSARVYQGDVLYLRLPLRLQENVHGSGIAAKLRSALGVGQVGLTIKEVRKQVAAFGPAAAKSLLFLGNVQRISISHCGARPDKQAGESKGQAGPDKQAERLASHPVKIWQASVVPGVTGSMPCRVGAIGEAELAKHTKKGLMQGASGLLGRLVPGAALVGSGNSRVFSNFWTMQIQIVCRPVVFAELAAGKTVPAEPTEAMSKPAEAAPNRVASGEPIDVEPQEQHEQQLCCSRSSSSANFQQEAAAAVHGTVQHTIAAGHAHTSNRDHISTELYKWQLSAVCDIWGEGAWNLATGAERSISANWVTSAVAVCTSQRSIPGRLIPAGGLFCPVAVTASMANPCHLGKQGFLISVQGPPGVLLFSPASAAEPGRSIAGGAAAAALTTVQQKGTYDLAKYQQSMMKDVAETAQQALAGVAVAWQELLVMFSTLGFSQEVYQLMPDLVSAAAAGDRDAMHIFKMMYQSVSRMPLWQLHNERLVHLQEGAFLSPESDQQQQQQSRRQPAVVASGLGEDARLFITQHLPLFNVPWSVVAQLEAANVTGLRLVSPSVLRPLLRRLGDVGPKLHSEPHPFAVLTPVQALQLLEYCCSDLTASDQRSSGGQATAASISSSSSESSVQPAAGTSAAAAAGPSTGPEPAGLPANIPEAAAAVVTEVFGQQGLAALRGLANQLQNQLVQGVDEVLNVVMDAMNDPRQQQQQQVATAAATSRTTVVDHTVTEAEAEDEEPDSLALNMNKVAWLKGLPIPTAAGTIVILGRAALFVYPDNCRPAPHSLMPSHLKQQFVSAECVAALSWAFKHAGLRHELNLTYYGFQQLARHLQEALGSTWELTQPAAAPSSSRSNGRQVQTAGPPVAAAAAAVPWNDGAAGGPYLDWLQGLWAVLLHVIAAAPSWDQSLDWATHPAVAAAAASPSRVAVGLRSAAERARDLGRGLADILAAEVAPTTNEATASDSAHQVASDSAAAATASDAAAAAVDAMWGPLAEWPLLPLVDGRLLKLKHRNMVLAVLPEYQQQQQARGDQEQQQPGQQQTPDAALSPAWSTHLSEPWKWLLPAAVAAGVPVLDPRFNCIVTTSTSTMVAAQTPSISSPLLTAPPTAPPTAAAAAAVGSSTASALPVQDLLGPQPALGRPPFLGPLVSKFLAAQQVLGSFKDSAENPPAGGHHWDESTWSNLFDLLADHPPRDLQPEGVKFLRSLPMFRMLPQQQGAAEDGNAAAAAVRCEGVASSSTAGAAAASLLVALDHYTHWELAPQAVLEECSGLLSLPSLPSNAARHILEHRPSWGELYSILGLTPSSLAEFLSSLLLPNLLKLSRPDRSTSLSFIQQHWSAGRSPLSQDRTFVDALRQLAFVPAQKPHTSAAAAAAIAGAAAGSSEIEEQLHRAEQLFDPTVPLFAKVLATMADPSGSSGASTPESSARLAGSSGGSTRGLVRLPSIGSAITSAVLFPAAPFDSSGWLQVLRALGLQCKITPETFMQLAQHIAGRAAALSAVATPYDTSNSPPGFLDVSGADPVDVGGLISAADALLSHLRSHWTGLGSDKAFWAALGRVQFLPASLGLPGGRCNRQVFTSCSNVAAHKDWPLVWSVLPLLGDGRTLPALLAQQLGTRSPPPLAAVLQHLHAVGVDGGEELLATWPDGYGSVNEATLAVLDHLDREGLSHRQADALSGAAFIAVAHSSRLVSPVQLFVRLGGAALAPFAWEVPGVFVGRIQLLKQLGVKDEPRAEDLVQALQRFEVALAGRRMNPNELSACLRLLAYLCSRSSAGDASYLASARRSGTALLVPTAGALLMPAGRVVAVGNAGGGVTAARLLGRADPQHLTLAHPQLSDHICRWLGVASLSDVLTEQLDPSLDLTPLPGINSTSLRHLQHIFASPDFASSVFSIAAAHAAAVPDLRQLRLGSVSQVCAAAAAGRLVLVEKLASQVVMKSNGRDVTRDSASRQVYEYFDSSSGTMYVATPPPGLPLSSLIAQVLSRALGSPLTLPLHPLLEVHNPEQLKSLQPVLLPGGYDIELESALASGHVGSPVQPADRALLRLRPLRHYTAGELVAVKRRPTAAATGNAVNLTANPSSSSSSSYGVQGTAGGRDDGSGSGHQLCYARVAVDAAPAAGQAGYRLSVEVQPGVYETLLSTQVFCFQSGAAGPVPAAPAASQAPDAAAVGGNAGRAGKQQVGDAGAGSSSSSTPAGALAGGQQMSASELATAVNEMLSAAGLPLDLDRQALLQRALASDQQLSAATAALAEMRQEVDKRESEVEALKSSWQCRVCFSRDVNQAFVGCGHMYCSTCMPSLAKCPVCRKPSAKIKLYR